MTRCPLGSDSHGAYSRRYNELLLATWVNNQPPNKTKSACAMVPLKPNELRRDATFASPPRGSTSAGMRNDPDDTIDARCAFSLRGTHARFKVKASRIPTDAAAR